MLLDGSWYISPKYKAQALRVSKLTGESWCPSWCSRKPFLPPRNGSYLTDGDQYCTSALYIIIQEYEDLKIHFFGMLQWLIFFNLFSIFTLFLSLENKLAFNFIAADFHCFDVGNECFVFSENMRRSGCCYIVWITVSLISKVWNVRVAQNSPV